MFLIFNQTRPDGERIRFMLYTREHYKYGRTKRTGRGPRGRI